MRQTKSGLTVLFAPTFFYFLDVFLLSVIITLIPFFFSPFLPFFLPSFVRSFARFPSQSNNTVWICWFDEKPKYNVSNESLLTRSIVSMLNERQWRWFNVAATLYAQQGSRKPIGRMPSRDHGSLLLCIIPFVIHFFKYARIDDASTWRGCLKS